MLSAMQARLSLFSILGTDPVDFNCSRVASQALPQSFASASLMEHFDPGVISARFGLSPPSLHDYLHV